MYISKHIPSISLHMTSMVNSGFEQKEIFSFGSVSKATSTSFLRERFHQGIRSTLCPERKSGIGNLQIEGKNNANYRKVCIQSMVFMNDNVNE